MDNITSDESSATTEIDILQFAERGHAVPDAPVYRVQIDGESIKIHTPEPTGGFLLEQVGKRPCAYELIAEFSHHDNQVIEPNEVVDLRKRRIKRFITAHKEIVDIFINGQPYPIERGDRSVADILSKVQQTPETYILFEEKDGPPLPLPANVRVKIHGCEVFHSQVQSGGSS